jgi:aminopeptidase YwaD
VNRTKKAALVISLTALSLGLGNSEEVGAPEKKDRDLLPDRLVNILVAEVSAENAMESIRGIIRFDRITASREYDQAAEYVLRKLKSACVPEASIEVFPKKESLDYYSDEKPDWIWQVGWSAKKAVLKIVDPAMKIADYDEVPIVLARMSRSYRGRAELVYVGQGTKEADYAGLDVKGKIVLARGYADRVYDFAVMERDAVGVVCFGASPDDPFKGKDHPDMVVWQVLSPEENPAKKPQFAFSLSEEKGRYLLSLLESGKKVELDVDVQTEFYENDPKIVTARIPGNEKPQEEFLFYAHLDHVKPSAGDNASGCAALIETARALSSLIRQGKMPPPRRSIRFVWGSEGPGSYLYILAHKERMPNTLAGLNVDMVGEDQQKTHSILRIIRNPDSLPSFLADLIENVIDSLDTRTVIAPTGKLNFMNYRFMPFAANSDHAVFNNGGIRVPMMMLNYSPDVFHHTSLDTPDKLEPTELKRILYLCSAVASFIADADDQDAHDLAQIVASNGAARVSRSLQKGLALLREGPGEQLADDFKAGKDYIRLAAKREEAAIKACSRLCADEKINGEIEDLAEGIAQAERRASSNLEKVYLRKCELHEVRTKERDLSPAEISASRIVPSRIGRHLNELWESDIENRGLDQKDRDFVRDFKERFLDSYIRIPEILNFVDGRNSLLEIRDFIAVEYFGFMTSSEYVGHPEDLSREYRRLAIDDLLKLMMIFKKAGLVAY